MSTRRLSLFVGAGLAIWLLLGAGIYFLLPNDKAKVAVAESPTKLIPTPGSSPAPKASTDSPIMPIAPSTRPQAQANSDPIRSFQYNDQGQLAAIIYADGSVYAYQYDAHGNKIRETSRTGRIWSYAYDPSHHPITIIDPEGRVTHKETSSSASNAN